MGFADYLSRNPSQPPPPLSKDDTQFILNTNNSIKYFLLNDTDKYQTRNDVIHNKAHPAQKLNAFCQIRNNNQSLANIPNYNSPTQINSIHSKSSSSSSYKSFIKYSYSNLSIKSSNSKFLLTNYKSFKINPV